MTFQELHRYVQDVLNHMLDTTTPNFGSMEYQSWNEYGMRVEADRNGRHKNEARNAKMLASVPREALGSNVPEPKLTRIKRMMLEALDILRIAAYEFRMSAKEEGRLQAFEEALFKHAATDPGLTSKANSSKVVRAAILLFQMVTNNLSYVDDLKRRAHMVVDMSVVGSSSSRSHGPYDDVI